MIRTCMRYALLVCAFLGALAARAADLPPSVIPPHHRAVAIKLDPADDKAHQILPGAKVDVSQTKKADQGKTESKVILKKLLVLAVDVQVDPQKPARVGICLVTVAVHFDDAPALTEAMKAGPVNLSLCKPNEESKPKR
jgi:Flp pilus assembly protein CpaB